MHILDIRLGHCRCSLDAPADALSRIPGPNSSCQRVPAFALSDPVEHDKALMGSGHGSRAARHWFREREGEQRCTNLDAYNVRESQRPIQDPSKVVGDRRLLAIEVKRELPRTSFAQCFDDTRSRPLPVTRAV